MEDMIFKSLATVWVLWLTVCVCIMIKWPDGFYAPKWAIRTMGAFLISCAVGVIAATLGSIWLS